MRIKADNKNIFSVSKESQFDSSLSFTSLLTRLLPSQHREFLSKNPEEAKSK